MKGLPEQSDQGFDLLSMRWDLHMAFSGVWIYILLFLFCFASPSCSMELDCHGEKALDCHVFCSFGSVHVARKISFPNAQGGQRTRSPGIISDGGHQERSTKHGTNGNGILERKLMKGHLNAWWTSVGQADTGQTTNCTNSFYVNNDIYPIRKYTRG